MPPRPGSPLARAARLTLAGVAVAVVLASFAWVLTRPLRTAARIGERVELTVMHWAGGGGQDEDRIVSEMIADFERAHPHVTVRRINPGDAASYYTKLQTMMGAGTPPDVFYVGHERVAIFASRGLLRPVEPLIHADAAAGRSSAALDEFFPTTLDCFRFDGNRTGHGPLYGIPKDFTPVGFYYNRDLFRRAGLAEPADDWTWDDFLHAARTIGRMPGCTGAHVVSWPAMVRLYLWTYGLDIIGDDFDELRTRDPAVIAALERLRSWRFTERGTLTDSSLQVTIEDSLLLAGNVGMVGPFGRWVVPTYRRIRDFEWDFAPLPRGTQSANAVFSVAWCIGRDSAHPVEAWELIKHMTGQRGQENTARSGLALPTMKSVARGPVFLDESLPPRRNGSFLVAAEAARSMPWPDTLKFEALLQGAFELCIKTGARSVPEALQTFERAWRRELEAPLARRDFPPVAWGAIVWSIAGAAGAGGLVIAILWLRGAGSRRARREELAGVGFVSPWLLGFALFTAFPLVLSLILAFSRWTGSAPLSDARWVGLANFTQMIGHDERFRSALAVTLAYAALAVPASQLFALFAAALMALELRFIGLFRSAWYLPSVLAGVGVAVLWRWIFDGRGGLLNTLLRPFAHLLGVSPPDWLAVDAATWGAPAFAIMSLWTIGGSMMIYLAGLKGISRELYEAAAIDGAGRLRRLLSVTLPMLSPVIFFNGIMAIIGSFQVFVQSFVMTSGGPGDATRFYVLYLYNQAFDYHEMGYASAMAWLLLLIVLTLTLLVMRGSRRFVYYEGLRT
ncbi:MAG: extracellular solute-binding protein [Planctomycetia bacterium]|nr:MAG: extracellular solute-binding protein [Planctomycetia bacterium]